MKSYLKIVALSGLFTLPSLAVAQNKEPKTVFQVADAWSPAYDVRADGAIVYGINDAGGNFKERVKSWKDHGYTIQFMTGIAWGQYKDYFKGKYDGKEYFDEGQKMKNGEIIWHGQDVPYTVPTAGYVKYIKGLVKQAIDAGVTAVYLEEPEFWARAGYSDAFKQEWQKFYKAPWQAQDESPEATYLSSKLKYDLYFNALKEVFEYVHTYGKSINKKVKCYVPTHSLINYASWEIVSPEASLAQLPHMDGYIAQVWTGTSRERVYFNGELKERTFENAFLEYGSMVSMTAPTGREMFFLTDPIEDRSQTWADYKKNYQATFTAQLMYPTVANYEVMPWPPRIYLGKFKMEEGQEKQPLSKAYGTQMQVMINSLNNMPLSKNEINGTKGINVLLANSIMFQRFPIHKDYQDPSLSNFYGLVMPLLKRGIPVGTVHMENLDLVSGLKDTKILIMSYANMKPLSAKNHEVLAKWVKDGGMLVYYGRDDDPFQKVSEWWNKDGNTYAAPSEHLFELMNIKPESSKTTYTYGKGNVFVVRENPKELVLKKDNDSFFLDIVATAYHNIAPDEELELKNYYYLERGPYDIVAVMEESTNGEPLHIKRNVIDLFDPELPVLQEKIVQPGEQAYLYDLDRIPNKTKPQVLCAASRVYKEKSSGKTYSFVTKSPSNTMNAMRILLPSKPKEVILRKSNSNQNIKEFTTSWDENSKTCLLKFENSSKGIQVSLKW
ncbi:hypothetical protein GON26_17120 [Flavobacterium sp. GA093]|uniref:Beta-galactosidase trimerisation domain-containing protein n=1 Tax=Flavobacterium hydrocarbonoxydans TaxID=2683249 RepID=A0A6I4NPB9_9FLAO|nr:hypothetical protein [Flavobacterium hydrocarbonoxydans]MWB96090.1 hypothetical protein [Flavobacterium hydrocarbonoxydans]